MVIELDMESEVPIYVQLRNQIVKGIGKGELKAEEKLPTVRQLAAEAGVNTMTVNKAYQILKAEGYIKIDRRHGAVVADFVDMDLQFREKLEAELELLSAEASITGMEKAEFLKLCDGIYSMQTILKSKIFAQRFVTSADRRKYGSFYVYNICIGKFNYNRCNVVWIHEPVQVQ